MKTTVVREAVPAWSASSYIAFAQRNAHYWTLTDTDLFVLFLLAVRANDAGQVTFARRDLVRLYGLDVGDLDDRPWQRALDRLVRGGWLTVRPHRGRDTYTLSLPLGREPRERMEEDDR